MKYKTEIKEIQSLKNKVKVIMLNNDNTYYRDVFLQELRDNFFDGKFVENTIMLSESDVETVDSIVKMKSLTTSKKIVTIIYNSKDLNKKYKIKKPKPKTISYEEKLIDIFNTSNTDTLVVLLPDTLDKRKALYKYCDKNGKVYKFEPVDDKTVKLFITSYSKQNEASIGDKEIKLMMSLVSNDLYLIKNELDKIFLYTNEVDCNIIKELVKKSADVVVYELSNLISKKDSKKAMIMLNECVESGITYFQILPLLIRQFRMLNYYKIYKDKFGKEMGVPYFLVKNYSGQADNFSNKEILRCMELLLDCETKLKTNVNKELLFEYLVLELCEGGK